MLQSAEGAQRVRYIAVAQLEMWRTGHDGPMPLDYSRLASVCYLNYILWCSPGSNGSNMFQCFVWPIVYRMHRPNYLVSWCSFLAHLLGIRYPTRWKGRTMKKAEEADRHIQTPQSIVMPPPDQQHPSLLIWSGQFLTSNSIFSGDRPQGHHQLMLSLGSKEQFVAKRGASQHADQQFGACAPCRSWKNQLVDLVDPANSGVSHQVELDYVPMASCTYITQRSSLFWHAEAQIQPKLLGNIGTTHQNCWLHMLEIWN